jgi:protein-disulfide isomerase
MSTQERVRLVLDVVSTTAIVIAAAIVMAVTIKPRNEQSVPTARAANLVESVDLSLASKGHAQGAKAAKVAIIEFSDFQCPFCGRFAKETLPQLKRDFIEAGKARFIYRDNPLESIHPFALRASAAAECAGQQGKYWEMHDAIFSKQGELADANLVDRARSLRLDAAQFSNCLKESALQAVKEDQAEAARLGLQSTPIFLIGRIQSDGTIKVTKRINGAAPYEAFKTAIAGLL